MKSEILTVGDLCTIHVGKSVEVFSNGSYRVASKGQLLGLVKNSTGYILNLNGNRRAYSLDEAVTTMIRLYE